MKILIVFLIFALGTFQSLARSIELLASTERPSEGSIEYSVKTLSPLIDCARLDLNPFLDPNLIFSKVRPTEITKEVIKNRRVIVIKTELSLGVCENGLYIESRSGREISSSDMLDMPWTKYRLVLDHYAKTIYPGRYDNQGLRAQLYLVLSENDLVQFLTRHQKAKIKIVYSGPPQYWIPVRYKFVLVQDKISIEQIL